MNVNNLISSVNSFFLDLAWLFFRFFQDGRHGHNWRSSFVSAVLFLLTAVLSIMFFLSKILFFLDFRVFTVLLAYVWFIFTFLHMYMGIKSIISDYIFDIFYTRPAFFVAWLLTSLSTFNVCFLFW